MPFGRPSFRETLGAIDFVLKNDYPARGEAQGIHHAVGRPAANATGGT